MHYISSVSLLDSVGAAVRSQRERRGWSRRELAAASGVSERFLAQLEAGDGNISLRGVRGAGKSTIGAALARKLGARFVEVDDEIEEAAGLPLADVFTLHGEAYYRRVEREVLTRLLADRELPRVMEASGDARSAAALVLATGGSIVNDPATYALLRARAITIWLRA